MKKNLLFLIFIISAIGYGQIPAYYNDVNLNLSGQALKDELAIKIINTHTTTLSYTPGVWDALKQTDLDPNDPTKVLLIYGWDDTDGIITNDRSRDKDMNGGNVGDWNREHTYAKSLASPNLGTSGPGADAHNLRPADTQWNSTRNNRMFADGSGNSGTTGSNWYPGDEWKGDVARMMMYMYLRYGTQCLPINVGVGTPVAGDNNMIDLFLQWNADDPVSALEEQRNPVLESLQGNRNPFIDNPAFATQIWGGPQAEDLFSGGSTDTEAPTAPTNLIASNVASFSVDLSWTASTDNIGVTAYNVYRDGVFIASAPSNNFNVIGLSSNTAYSFYVEARDAAGNVSGTSNSINITTTTSSGGNASDLFLSEYIEGSSFNKAIEVANFTGSSVDLSIYSIKKQTNGAGSWSGGLTLIGTLVNGDVYVVANSSANPAILSVTDISTSSSELTFNGNDAVGLFKNDVLIDILGTFNGGTANFAQNTTLIRKETITSPVTTYDVAEWDSFASDTFTDLGTHTYNGGSGTDTEAPSTPAGLIASNTTFDATDLSWTASTDNVGVTGYNVYQDGILLASTANTNYNVIGLTPETAYAFYVEATDAAGNISLASNTANVTTTVAPDTQAPTAPTGLIASNTTFEATDISWTASTDNVGVTGYNVYQDGVLLASTANTNYSVNGLTPETAYAFHVEATDAAGNISTASNTANVTTTAAPSGGDATDLFLSEYIEGSSFNKAIEVANFTGSSVDLSIYSIKKQTNGAGSWSGGLTLTGTLVNGDVYVIAHSSADPAILNVADVSTAVSEVTFNGNDAVGLFKNDVLIDILGTFNGGTANFAQNTTLIRKETISSPVTTYDVAEWDSFASDTFTDLGTHTYNGGSGTDTEAPSTPAGLIASNTTFDATDLSWSASTDNVGVTGYDVYQDGILLATTANTNYSVIGLTPETAYAFYVEATDAAGNISLASNTANVTTTAAPDTEAPSAPTNFAASNITETSADLTWTASTDNVGVTGYDIYQDGVFVATTTSTNYSATSLTAGISYTFEVYAFDDATNISAVASVNFTTLTPVGGTTLLHEGFFEGGFDGWIDGGSDCASYSGSRSFEGNGSIRIRDNSGASSSMTLQNIDVSPYDTVEVEFYFYSYSMENNEDFWLRYHDGSSWTTVETFVAGTDFNNNNFYSATVTLDNVTSNFVSNAQFRFQNDASGNNDHIYIDQVSIKGIIAGGSARPAIVDTNIDSTKEIKYISSLYEVELEFEDDFIIISDSKNSNRIQVKYHGEKTPDFSIYNLLGQTIKNGKLNSEFIDVTSLIDGVYILEINDGEESMTKKFIK